LKEYIILSVIVNISFSQKVMVEAIIDQIAISSLGMNPSYLLLCLIVVSCNMQQHFLWIL